MKADTEKKGHCIDCQGRVTEAILSLLKRQIADRGVVVWYDPQKAYDALVARINLPGVRLFRFEDSFFRLREQLEPLLEFVNDDGSLRDDADVPPQAVVYVPMERKQTGFALIETETAGTVVEPNAAVPERDSRLGRLVEAIFAGIAPAKAEQLSRQADEGLLTLEELDRMAGEAVSPAGGALQVIFGNVSAEEILLQFVATDSHDEKVISKNTLPEVLALAEGELGWSGDEGGDPAACRAGLQRYLLVSEFLLAIPDNNRPDALSGMTVTDKSAQRDSIAHLCRSWRNRFDLQDSYAEAAVAGEKKLGIGRLRLPMEAMETNETFLSTEQRLMEWVAGRFARGDFTVARDSARNRLPGFWPRKRPELQLGWRVIESAAELSLAAAQVEKLIRRRKLTLNEIVEAYTRHAEPWMRIDRLARELETRHARWEMTGAATELLDPVLTKARDHYQIVAGLLAETYANTLREAGYGSDRYPDHTKVFRQAVFPFLEKSGKTAFFMVDALRYEMACELIEGLEREFEVAIEPVLGRLPGITPLGMAALLPKAEEGLALEKCADGMEVRIGNQIIGDRKSRLNWLMEQAGVPVCIAKLSETLKAAFRRRKEFAAAKLIVVTSQEIDLLGEEGDEEGIRLYLQDVLEKLRRALRVLSRAGIERFVIGADHGFLLVQGVDPGLRMDAPGGRTAELHPRAWIGEGGSSGEGYFRAKASEMALGGPFDFAFPLGLATFKVKGGSGAYLHGGVSPAEHILPLVLLTVRREAVSAGESRVRLSIAKVFVTNRLFSVSIELSGEGLFPDTERRVRIEVLSGRDEVGQAATAAYGFEDGTREVLVKAGHPNAVTLMLSPGEPPASISIRVLDCETQVVLDSIKDLPVRLSI